MSKDEYVGFYSGESKSHLFKTELRTTCRNSSIRTSSTSKEYEIWCIDDLLEIAESDLRAAEILRKEGFIPQSIFLTSQSVEKVLKSILLINGDATCEDLPKSVGHKPFRKRFAESFKRTVAKYEEVLHRLNLPAHGVGNRWLTTLMKKAWKELPEFLEDIKKELEEINMLYKELGKDFTKANAFLNFCITMLENDAAQLRNSSPPELRPSDEELEELTENFNQMMPGQQQVTKEEVRQILEAFNRALKPLAVLSISMEGLLCLQTLFEATEASTTTRYPITPNKEPKEIQNIIPTQKLRRIHEALKQVIPHIKTAVKYLKELKINTKYSH